MARSQRTHSGSEGSDALVGKQGVSKGGCLSPALLVGIAVIVGLAVGLTLSMTGYGQADITTVLALPGKLWLKCLKCIVLPMIVFSMVEAMVMMRSLPGARTVGVTVVGLYGFTTVMAAMEGCVVSAAIITPYVTQVNVTAEAAAGDRAPDITRRSSFDTILGIFDNLVPSNLVNDAATNNLLPVIIASMVFGLLVPKENEDGGKSYTLSLVGELNGVVMQVVTAVMTITPIGVGSLVLASAAKLDLKEVGANVGVLILTVVAGLLMHSCIVYPTLLVVLGKRNPCTYFPNIFPALATALGASSSAVALPVTTVCVVEKNGVKPHIAKFVLSLGATVNMDGTSIYLICATYFLGTLQGISFGVGEFVSMALLATFCSMGAAPVPSASLVLLATIMTAVGVPFNETFGIISAVDWMLDRLRTCVNVAGDATVTGIVDTIMAKDYVEGTNSENSESEDSNDHV